MEAFIGTILPWAVDWAPVDWALCNGAVLPINQYQALFSLIGTKYGGNGTTTFALPDLRARVPIGMGQQPNTQNYVMGTVGGVETVTLTNQNLPAHNHTFSANVNLNVGAPANAGEPTTNTPAANTTLSVGHDSVGDVANIYNTSAPTFMTQTMAVTGTTSGTTGVAGSGLPVTNVQPYQVINYIICLNGLYPSRP